MGDKRTNALLKWYNKNKRDLPWRHTRDPYAILVSEMMLQQTTVETVLRYYDAFLLQFPDVYKLSAASEEAVLSAWQGLGYYSRARNLHRSAKIVAEEFGGSFPQTYEDVIALPGVGAYIVGAVMSIAFDVPYPAVDGNVLRVLSRLDGIMGDVTSPAVRKDITARVQKMIPMKHAGDFTQSLMELGALVCRPVAPRCAVCPVGTYCTAYKKGIADQLPVKKKKARTQTVKLWAVAVTAPRSVLMQYRAGETLLKNMWGLPVIEKKKDVSLLSELKKRYALDMINGKKAGHVTHVFTHRRWEMDVVHFEIKDEIAVQGLEWIRWENLKDKPIPTAFKKVMDTLQKDMRRSDDIE